MFLTVVTRQNKFHTHNMTLNCNINELDIATYSICNEKSVSSRLFVTLARRDLSQVGIPRVTLLRATAFVFFQQSSHHIPSHPASARDVSCSLLTQPEPLMPIPRDSFRHKKNKTASSSKDNIPAWAVQRTMCRRGTRDGSKRATHLTLWSLEFTWAHSKC